MTFKDSLAQDWQTFLNLEEFSTEIEIDDVKLSAVVIKHTGNVKNANIASKHDEYYIHPEIHNEPLIGDFITVYFKACDYFKERGRLPQNSEFTRINGKRYRVESAKDEMGIMKITCAADRMPIPRMAKLPGLYE